MAPTVTLHAFAPNDLNGSVLHTITDEDPYFKSLSLKVEREGLGGAELVLSRTAGAEMFAFTPELFFRVLVHAYSDTVYYPWGFFLNKRQATVIHREEDGAEEWHFGGAGPKMYLSRAALGIGGPLSGWNVDLANGVWRWGDSATAGRILGRIIAQDGNMDDPALPDLTTTFDQTDDSSSVAWTDTSLGTGDAPYTIPIGTSLLESLWDLEDLLELTSWIELGTVASPKFELNVSQGLGEDKTGSAFGAGVCLLKEGVNIADDAVKLEGSSLRKASHVIVEGADGAWVVVERLSFTPGDFVKYAKTEFPRTSQTNLLTKSGLRWLQRQDNGERELSVEILPGAVDASGLYFPAPDRVLWLSNLISVDTSADGSTHTPLDIQPSEDQLVTGFLLETHNAADDADATALARSWDVTVYLNRERPGNIQKTPDQRSAASGGGGCKCLRLCGRLGDDVLLGVTSLKSSGENPSFPKGNANDGDDETVWSEAVTDPAIGVAGAYWAADLGSEHLVAGYRMLQMGGDSPVPSNVATEVRIYGSDDPAAWTWLPSGKLSADPASNGWTLVDTYTGALALNDSGRVEFPSHATYRYWLYRAVSGGTADWDVETFELLLSMGTSASAAHCDHAHHHSDLAGRDDGDAHPQYALADETETWMPGHLLTSYPFVISCHRGDIGSADSYPENTLEAVQQAAVKGARMVEMDVQRSADGTWHLMHDTTVTRTTDGTGTLSAMTDAAIAALNIDGGYGYNMGRHGTTLKVPTLEAVLTVLSGHDVIVNLDNKDTGGDAGATSLAEFVRDQGWLGRVAIHSYSTTALTAIKAVSSRIHTSISTNVESDPVNNDDVDEVIERETEWTSRADADQYAPKYAASFIHPDFDYGIDETSRLEDMFSYGIRFYHTLNLDLALAVRERLLTGDANYGGRWEVVMTGSGASLEPVTNDAETDWLYAFVT